MTELSSCPEQGCIFLQREKSGHPEGPKGHDRDAAVGGGLGYPV